jgi:hypothetical protein
MSVAEYRNRGLKANKYGARATVVNGIRFDSKLEAERYLYWNNLWQAGAIRWFLRQVPFALPGGIVYRLDFLVVMKDGTIKLEDVKGHLTRVSQNKIIQVQAIFGVAIDLIQKKGQARAKPRARGRK